MEWKEVQLGTLLNFRRGHDLPHSQMIPGNIPVAGSNGVIGMHNEATPISPILTIGRSGNIGTPYIYEHAWAHNTTLYVDDFKGNDPLFLFYLCKTLPFANFQAGSAVPTLNRNHIHPLIVKCPTLKEDQRRIASILSSLDRKIELNNKINAQLEEMAQAIFKSWFVDFEPFKDGKFVESELGMIPEGWRVGTLSEIVSITKKSINPAKNPNLLFAHYSLPAFDNGEKPEMQYGNEIMSNKLQFQSGSILLSKLNPYIKRLWYVDRVLPNSICSTEFIPLLPNKTEYTAFVYTFIANETNYAKIMSGVQGATNSHQRLSPEDILKMETPLSEDVIIRFSSVVLPILKMQFENKNESLRLSQLRDTLLPKLMSGEIEI